MTSPASPLWTPVATRSYVVQIADLGRSGLVNLDALVRIGGRKPPHPDEWRCLADFLVPCGRLSRIFLPTRGNGQNWGFRKLRGAKLRELFTISDDWPLKERAVRNNEEHFDERFDQWLLRQPVLTTDSVESRAPIQIGAPPLRLIDRETWTVSVDDARLELPPIHRELQRIVRRCCELEPLSEWDTPQLAYLLATLPDWPVELRMNAPTRHPDQTILTGTQTKELPEFEEMISHAVEASRATAERADPDQRST